MSSAIMMNGVKEHYELFKLQPVSMGLVMAENLKQGSYFCTLHTYIHITVVRVN